MIPWATRFQVRQHVRQSLWAVPLVGTFVGAGLAAIDLAVEDNVSLPSVWTYSESAAGSLLSAVAGAMIGLIGLVVTIGVLVVQMATGTLSPRFMRLWYRDRLQKVVLASFTATFAFSFVLLREVGAGNVPNLGVTLAGAAVIVDLFLLLLYLDRFVHALRPVAVGAAMSKAGLTVARTSRRPGRDLDSGERRQPPEGTPDLRVRAPSSGAVQAVNLDSIVDYAHAHDLACFLCFVVGDFVAEGAVLMDVHGTAPRDAARRLQGMVALGHERTIDQDPAYAMRIIVDIAIRALSPAVNDPTTATQMVNHLGVLLQGVGSQDDEGGGLLHDGDGTLRLVVPTRSWDNYLELALSEIRAYGRTSSQVCRRLRSMLEELAVTALPANQAAVRRQIELLDRAVVRGFPDADDRALAMGEDRQGLGGSDLVPDRE